MKGVIKQKNEKGFGFIRSNGVDHFFHRSSYEYAFDDLVPGQVVYFDTVNSPKRPRAERVRLEED